MLSLSFSRNTSLFFLMTNFRSTNLHSTNFRRPTPKCHFHELSFGIKFIRSALWNHMNTRWKNLFTHPVMYLGHTKSSGRDTFLLYSRLQSWAQDNFLCPVLPCRPVIVCPGERQDRTKIRIVSCPAGQGRTGQDRTLTRTVRLLTFIFDHQSIY